MKVKRYVTAIQFIRAVITAVKLPVTLKLIVHTPPIKTLELVLATSIFCIKNCKIQNLNENGYLHFCYLI